jgi:DNA-binding MarR family transcriptional regulator
VPFVSRRAPLKLSPGEVEMLTALSQSRTEAAGRVQRAAILLRYHGSDTVSEIARGLGTNRPRVERCVNKGFAIGGGAGVGRFAGPGAAGRP